MKLILTSAGSFPRAGNAPEQQILWHTIAALDRGEKTSADLADAENEMTRQAIEEQVRAGIELLTDGQIRWNDPVSHFAARLSGIRIGAPTPYFDTDTSYRQPVVIAEPRQNTPALVDEYRFACNALGLIPTGRERAGRLSVKPVLIGPYTLAQLSRAEIPEMNSLESRVEAYAVAVAAEIRALADSGAQFIQVDEPAVVRYTDGWNVFERAIARMCEARDAIVKAGRRLQLALHVYFGDASSLYEKLVALPVDVLGLDFCSSPGLVEVVTSAGSPKPLILGVIDGRNPALESPADVARRLERLLPRIQAEQSYLSSSCGLDYLPRNLAVAKLQSLASIRSAMHL